MSKSSHYQRRRLIEKGDVFVGQAEGLLAGEVSSLSEPAAKRRAARRYTSAATAYRKAGLSLLARRCHASAANLWLDVGETNLHETSLGWSRACPIYWED
jgi:hypothetical protein